MAATVATSRCISREASNKKRWREGKGTLPLGLWIGWVYFVHHTGVAETLDMRDEGETVGFLTTNKSFTPVAHVRYIKRGVDTISLVGGTK